MKSLLLLLSLLFNLVVFLLYNDLDRVNTELKNEKYSYGMQYAEARQELELCLAENKL